MSEPDDLDILDALLTCAREQQAHAYAPYSRFHVGAAIAAASGRIYGGANVENVASPLGLCAESAAVAAMIAGGDRLIARVLIVGAQRRRDGSYSAAADDACTPCGGCRQRLREFAAPSTPVHICRPDGSLTTFALGELLPHPFARPPTD